MLSCPMFTAYSSFVPAPFLHPNPWSLSHDRKVVVFRLPPLRLPLGTDTLAAIAAKNAYVAEETQTWKDLSISTDFAA